MFILDMDIVNRLPLDLSERILREYARLYIHPRIHGVDTTAWMWRSSPSRLRIATERGSIQVGHCDDYDGWAKTYIKMRCATCDYARTTCHQCKLKYREKIRG